MTDALHRTEAHGTDVAPPRAPLIGLRAWRAWKKRPTLFCDTLLHLADRYRYVWFGVLVVTYLAGFNGQWRAEPDSALYLTIARNLATGAGYTYHGEHHDLAYPGLPWMMAGVFKVFGTESMMPAHVLMLGLGLFALALNYRIFLLFGGRPLAVVMTCGLGFTRIFYRYAFQLMTDMPFLVGVLAFFAGYEALRASHRKKVSTEGATGVTSVGGVRVFDWALMTCGLALVLVTRPAMYAFVPVVLLAAIASALRGRKRLAAVMVNEHHARSVGSQVTEVTTRRVARGVNWRWPVVGFLIIAMGVAFYVLDPRRASTSSAMGGYEEFVLQQYTTHVDQLRERIVGQNIPELLRAVVTEALFGIELGPWVTPVMSVVLLVLGLAVTRERPLWGLWLAATLAMMIFILPVDRYLLPVLPVLIYGWWRGISGLNRWLWKPWGDIAFVLLLLLGTGANVTRVGAFVRDQQRDDFYAHYKDGRYAPLIDMAGAIREHVGPGDLVLSPTKTARVLTFWSDRRVNEVLEYTKIDINTQQIWVVYDPADKEKSIDAWLPGLGIYPGPVVARVERDGLQPLTLHRALR